MVLEKAKDDMKQNLLKNTRSPAELVIPMRSQPTVSSKVTFADNIYATPPPHKRQGISAVKKFFSNIKRSFLNMEASQGWLLVYVVGLLLTSIGNSIFFKKMSSAMPNYPYFLSQMSTLVYVPIFFGIVWYTMRFTENITPEMTEFPKMKFFWMGTLDAVSGLFMLFGGVYTKGTTQVVLMQGVIPLSLAATVIFLKVKYHKLQYSGAFFIILGVVVVVLPKFLWPDQKSTEQDLLLFNVLFFISDVPQAISAVYKEIAFKNTDLDVNYLNAWVALWQLLFGFLLVPFNTLSFLGPAAISWEEIPGAIANGAKCLGGVDTILTDCGGLNQRACDSCAGSWMPMLVYFIFNLAFNIFISLVIKHGGAAVMFIVMTFRLPLSSFAFTMPFIMGDATEPFTPYDVAGLFVLLFGLVMYRYGGTLQAKLTAISSPPDPDTEEIPVLSYGQSEVRFVRKKKHNPRTHSMIRSSYYSRLGVASPPPQSSPKTLLPPGKR
eukprot:GILJ01003930.1.p1 GENE.GILJ01003930.1~~GILJ01003930.1.p1  ORF type:complete len:493 (+),score=83.13 GILJ01003930.1:79-1557(+)